MLLAPIVTLVKTIDDFKKVAGAADFAAARESLKFPPAAYVVPLADSAKPNELDCGGVEQHVVERFGVIVAVGNVRDVRGDAVNAELETVRKKVITKLLGTVPAAGYDIVQYGGGRILLLDVTVLWWQLEFITGYYERT